MLIIIGVILAGLLTKEIVTTIIEVNKTELLANEDVNNRVNRIVYVGSEAERSANTYVAVSISEQYLWFYKNGELLVSSPVVTGLKGNLSKIIS